MNGVAVGDFPVLVFWRLVLGLPGADVFHSHLVRGDAHADVSRIAEKRALFITIGFQIPDAVVSGEAGLRDHLIDYPIEFLLGVEIVMRFEHRRDVVAHEELVDGHFPAGTVLFETIAAVRILAAPFVECSHFHPAACRLIPAQEVMEEYKFVFGPALLKGLFEPLIL